jgi:hypothetical protein
MRNYSAAKRTEDAGIGILVLCALMCAFAVFGLYMREQIKTTSTTLSSIQLQSAKDIKHKPARAVDVVAPANSSTTRAFRADVKKGADKQAARRTARTKRTYPAYAVPY